MDEEAGQRCDAILDNLASVMLKLRSFQLPGSRSNLIVEGISKYRGTIQGLSRQILILAMTTCYFKDFLAEDRRKLSRKVTSAHKAILTLTTRLKRKVNKALSQLSLLLEKHSCDDGVYAVQLAKAEDKLQKSLDQCRRGYDPLCGHASLPSWSHTSRQLKKLFPSTAEIVECSADFEQEFELLKQHIIGFERSRTLETLETNLPPPSTPPAQRIGYSTSANAKSGNVMIDQLMQSPRGPVAIKKTLAEEQGFVSRIEKTRREPNWSAGLDAASVVSSDDEKEEPGASDEHNAPLSLSFVPDHGWPLQCSDTDQVASRQDDNSPAVSQSTSNFDLDEVYDSYHDHDPDALLGVPGVIVERQPSHKRPQKKSPARSIPKASPPAIPRKMDSPRTAVSSPASLVSQSCNVTPVRPKTAASEKKVASPLSFAELSQEAIRDQYY